MKKRTTRCLALLLAVVMVLSVMPVAMAEGTSQTATLVTDASTLKVGDEIVIAAKDANYALGTTQNDNNRAAVAVTKAGEKLTLGTTVQKLTLEKGAKDNTFAFATGSGYLYAASSSKNYLKTESKLSNNSSWSIAIVNGTAEVIAQGTNTRNTMKYNPNTANANPLFACYESGQKDIAIYKIETVPARENGVVAIEDIQNGDTVVIFNPANGKTLSTEYSGFYNKGTDVTLADGKLTGWTEADLWTVSVNKDGTFTFATKDGKKLSMDTSYTSTPLDKANDTWKVTAVEGKNATYYIDNAGRTDQYRLQWFATKGNWSAHTGTGTAFEQQFYLVVDSGTPDPDPEPEPDPDPKPEALFKDGEKIVIYNPANMKALSSEYTGNYNKGTDVTMDNGTLSGWTEADVWTVGVNEDGTYTFSTSEGKKLSMTTQYSSMPLDKENPNWEVTTAKTEDCYYIKNTGRNNYIEWYADKGNWSSYNKLNNEALFAQAFYRVRKSGIVTSLSAGDTVVIFNPANSKALSSEYTGNYNKGTDVTLTDGKMAGYTKADIWTVGVNEDGTYTFSTSEGKKLSMTTQYSSMPLDKENPNWEVTPAKTENCFYIKNTGRNNYIEWYADKGNWSSYNKLNNEALFAQQFYLVVDDGGSDKPSGDLPQPGDKFVIYNQNAQAVLAAENDSKSIEKAAATVADGKATPANGAVVFTVERNGDYYRFKSEAYGYLCSNGTGSNAFYSKDFSEEGVTENDADWLVRTCSGEVGGFEMESRVAKYKGHSQWLEYFSDVFQTYSMYSSTGDLDYTIYSFFFYPVVDGVKVTGGIVNAPAVDFGTIFDAYVGQAYTLNFTVDAVFGVGTLTAKLGTEDLTVNTTENGYSVTIPVEKVTGDKLTVTVSGQDKKGTTFEGIAEITVKDEPVISNVKPAAGTQTGENKRPAISADIVNAGDDAIVTMSVNNKTVNAVYANGKVVYTPTEDLADGRTTVTVTVTRAADSKTAEMTWSFIVGTAQYKLYFGQLHSHTQYSDGSGSLDSALEYVKDLTESANVDFVAFTDHSNYFDSKNNPNVEAALYDTSLVKDSDPSHSWKTYKDTVAKFNKEHAGKMVAIAGFEMTWSGGPGHINTFNTPGIVSRNNTTLNNKDNDAGMKAYYALLSQGAGADSISQFNHPGTTFGTFKDFSYWDPVIDSRMYMVEVGNGEGQIGAGGYYPSYSEYIKALDKGWHLAPTNNQDNHKGRWGNANDARDVILADDFSEQGIYAAIRAMRMYATEDKNLEIGYTVNGMMLGSAITEKPEKLSFHVTFRDPDSSDSIKKVELVANSGIVAYSWENAADLARGEVSVELAPDYSYYFVRITEGDGDLAVTAPVWVGETLKLGISSAECGTATPVTDEELTITTTFFNSEAKAATIKSITYTTGSTTLGTDTTGYALAASSTLGVDFKYTPDKARVMTITVTAVIEQDGKEYTFTKDVELDVLDASQLVYIGIDASHYNEYVAGNYKDSMGNFGELAAAYSVRTVTLKTSEELIAACSNPKYKALILTVPSRRNGETLRKPYKTYSDAEISAINDFNEKGGMVVLAGWSDYYERYEAFPAADHMAAQQNKVLAALGSSLRISDDGTMDDKLNGGQPQRLYFSSYNLDHFLMAGVEYNAEHPNDVMYTERFSQYGGASIYAVGTDGNPTSELPGTVDPMVYGHATTYSKDQDSDGLGGAATPKYAFAENDSRLLVMASEQLAGKGMIVVAGAAFMSNFEVQAQLDNGAEKNYSNYKICENLVQYLNPVKITPIETVQEEAEEGVKFTVEGIVTSNASGYDKNTAFFDCIYVQDETAGINAFPVAGEFKIGDKVRISGRTSSYQGERQIKVASIEKRGEETPVEPKKVTAADLENKGYLGSLVTVEGTATKIEYSNGLIQTIMVRDDTGKEARIFIDGYITTDKDVENAVVGCHVVATGLASYDDTFTLDGTAIPQRIRIRNRADVVCTESETPMVWNITYVTDGGTINGTYPKTYTEGTVTVLPTDVTKPGYTFLGWFTAYTGGVQVRQIGATETGDKVFYAHWKKNADPIDPIIPILPGIIGGNTGSNIKLPFGDVTVSDWFYDDVRYVYANGIMDGTSSDRFAPNAPLTRAMIVTILYRMDGSPAVSGASVFTDADSGMWYGKAVAWAAANGIVNGYGSGLFGPNDPVTREQLAAILYRYTAYCKASTTMNGDNLASFTDLSTVSGYALESMNWAVGEKLLKGANSKLDPKANATRAQVAAIIHRYLER